MAYDNPGGIIAAVVILEIIAVSCVVLRLLSSHRRMTPRGISDWLIVAALVCSTGLSVMEIYGVAVEALAKPLGGTIEDPRAVTGRLNKAKHIELSFLLLGILALGLIKTSITFLYWRIFETPRYRRVLIVWIVVIVIWATGFILAGLLECGSHLLALFGTPQSYLHSCGSAIPSGWGMVGSDIGTDLITLIMPIPMIWSLKMPTSKKILVVMIFMIGLLSVGASIAKAYIYIRASLGKSKEDAILILTGISIWNLIEVQVGIVAACGPTLRPILSELVPRASLVSLLDKIRSHISSGDEASKDNSYTKTVSNDNLVQRDYAKNSDVSREDLEMQARKPDTIHVRRDFSVEQV